MNNTVKKLILHMRSCKLHKKLGLPNPVFITAGRYLNGLYAKTPNMLLAKQNEAESSHF